MSELKEANDNEMRQRLKKTIKTIENEEKSVDKKKKNEQPIKIKSKEIIKFNYQRFWTRVMIVLSISILVYITSTRTKETFFAREKESLHSRSQSLICTNNENYVEKCSTIKCGRFVKDNLLLRKHVDDMDIVTQEIMKLSSSNSGVIKLDLHSGHLSNDTTDKPDNFINIRNPDYKKIIRKHILAIHESYLSILLFLKHDIEDSFFIDSSDLYIAEPTYFKKITNSTIINKNNEYWHLNNIINNNNEDEELIKNKTSGQHITVILYFNNFNKNFTGGRFLFNDGNINSNNKNQGNNQLRDQYNKTLTIIEPKRGRVVLFTNGDENLYNLEKIISGELLILIVTFTCDPAYAINLKTFYYNVD